MLFGDEMERALMRGRVGLLLCGEMNVGGLLPVLFKGFSRECRLDRFLLNKYYIHNIIEHTFLVGVSGLPVNVIFLFCWAGGEVCFPRGGVLLV